MVETALSLEVVNGIISTAFKLLQEVEGFREKAYQDTVKVWTIGFGRTGKDVTGKALNADSVTTKAKEIPWVCGRLNDDYIQLSNLVVPTLKPNQYSALLVLVYNIGMKAFRDSSLLKAINANRPEEEIEKCWMLWTKQKELTNRRHKEIELWNLGA